VKYGSHPGVSDAIKTSVAALKERMGSSQAAIEKYIVSNSLIPNFKRHVLRITLNINTEKGRLVRVKNSWKLSAEERSGKAPVAVAAKPAVKKVAAPKKAAPVKKAAAPKASPKKAAPKKAAPKKAAAPKKEASKKAAPKEAAKKAAPKKAAAPKKSAEAAAPAAPSPTAASPKAASPKAASPKAASPMAASPKAATPKAATPKAAASPRKSPGASLTRDSTLVAAIRGPGKLRGKSRTAK
jgi:hypothetical protein